MRHFFEDQSGTPQEQGMRGIRIRPANSFIEFAREEIDQSIAERFEQQAREYPHRIALKSGEQLVTYKELNGLANRIARTILSQRREREEPIALLIEQGVIMIAAILGVLKTSKIYIPLDPSYPSARSSHILADSDAELILTNSRNLPLAKALDQKGIPCINIDGVDASVSSENLDLSISPDAPANILYTSGSTGRPKGVVQTHRNILHDIRHYTNSLAISSSDRMTLLYSCSVHGSVRGIFGALLKGASLYPLSIREEGLDSLAALLIKEKITIYHSVPTVFRHFAMTLRGDERFPSLRVIRFGGERVLAKDIELCRKHFPADCIICTGLGTSETAHLTQYLMDNETAIPGGVVPAGYPVEDMEVLLLDELGEEVGFGIVGELAVRSRYLSPGYWQNPSLTVKTFLTDPSGGDLRIYRTGDLGRRHSNGCIDILGRTDFQIKVRGFRIEVAEIEAVLLELDCVGEAVVNAWEDSTGENRLAAYIVPGWRKRPTTGDLRDLLKKRLPDTMIPDSFIILEAMPLTPNGKFDRKALPAPDSKRPGTEDSYVAPRTPIENVLAGIWCEILGFKEVGIHDNFFELGGHSLLATQIISQLRKVFHVEIPLRSLFEYPTIAGLAIQIIMIQDRITDPDEVALNLKDLHPDQSLDSKGLRTREMSDLGKRIANLTPEKRALLERHLLNKGRSSLLTKLEIRRRGFSEPCVLSFAQQRLWFLDQLEPGSSAYNIPRTIRLSGRLNVTALQQSIGEILRRHEVLRTTFSIENDQPVQRITPATAFSLPEADLSAMPEGQREGKAKQLASEEASRPFDLVTGPLMRATLLRLKPEDHVLLLTMHHIISDGWSMGILYRELSVLYEAFSKGKPSPLPELPIQYADFAVWQREWLQGKNLEEQLTFWKEQLRDITTLELSTDHPRPPVQTFHGATYTVQLPQDLTEALQGLSRKEGVTLFMTLLTAFQCLLAPVYGAG